MSKEVTDKLLDELIQQVVKQYIGLDISIYDICDVLTDRFMTIANSENLSKIQDAVVKITKEYFDKLVNIGFTREEALEICCFSRQVLSNTRTKK